MRLSAPATPAEPAAAAEPPRDERDVPAVVSGQELTLETAAFQAGIPGHPGHHQQLGGADGGHGPAANPPGPLAGRRSLSRRNHIATVPC